MFLRALGLSLAGVALDFLHSGIVEMNSEKTLRICPFLTQFSFNLISERFGLVLTLSDFV